MDAILATRTILLADVDLNGVVSLVGQNVYGGQLPEHYNPEVTSTAEPAGNGPAITLTVKGGTSHSEIPMQFIDVQLTVWGGINQNYLARSIYNRASRVLDGMCNLLVLGAGIVNRLNATVPGIDMVDPDTGWVMIVGSFNVVLLDDSLFPADFFITEDSNFIVLEDGVSGLLLEA